MEAVLDEVLSPFEKAARFAMPFGKHRGTTLAEIIERDDDGIFHLGWALTIEKLHASTREMIEIFLNGESDL